MSRIVAAAATTGTGSDALKKNERALCFTKSTTSRLPSRIPPMPPNVFENVVITTGTLPCRPVSSRMPVPRLPSVPVPCASSKSSTAS